MNFKGEIVRNQGSNKIKLIFTVLALSFLAGCTAVHDEDGNQSSFQSDVALESPAMKIIEAKCASCHGPSSSSGGIGNLLSVEYLLSSGLVVAGDSAKGRLVGSMADQSMPIGTSVVQTDIDVVKKWIDEGLSLSAGAPLPLPQPPPSGGGTDPDITGSPEQVAALTIVKKQCGACHGSAQGGAGGVSNLLNVKHLLDAGLIIDGDPTQGRLIGSMKDGSMPPVGPMPADEIALVESWVRSGVDASGTNPLPPETPLEPTFASINEKILIPKCVACHGPNLAEDNYRVDSYAYLLGNGAKTMVIPGDSAESKLFKSVNDNMPPTADGYLPLTGEEISVIEEWIQAGAPKN